MFLGNYMLHFHYEIQEEVDLTSYLFFLHLSAPVFQNLPRRVIYAKFGETVKIDCTASGNPKPVVSIVRSHPFIHTLKSNVIKIATSSQGGRYDCTAENSMGKIKFPFLIRVSGMFL